MILYNLRTTSVLGYRITKFTDGEVESSYLTSDLACDCPAGHRATCRHRQMLPALLPIIDTEWFFDWDGGKVVTNINGTLKHWIDNKLVPAEQDTEAYIPDHNEDATESENEDSDTGQHTTAESLPPCDPSNEDNPLYGTAPFILMGALDELQADNEAKRARLSATEQTVRTSPAWRRL